MVSCAGHEGSRHIENRMYFLTIHPGRSIVFLTFAGRVDEADAKRCREEMETVLPTLKPPCCLLTDFSALDEMD